MSGFKGTPGPWEVMNSTDVFSQLGAGHSQTKQMVGKSVIVQ